MTIRRMLRGLSLASAFALCVSPARGAAPPAHRQLLVVLDGLRPDYVTPDLMPKLHALGRRGVVFRRHHSVFPTVTRVNASSIATGVYPGTHGLMGNSVFFPAIDSRRFLDTGDRENLLRIESATHARLLTAPTLGEILQGAGKKVLAVGSGTPGAAYLLNHKLSGGAILHTSYTMPDTFASDVRTQFGETPPAATPNAARNRRAVDLFLKFGLSRIDPAVTLMWLSDPDTTAHEHGIGHPLTTESLKRVDAEVGRIEEGLRAAGLFDDYDIWVTSDHGFSTHGMAVDLGAIVRPFAGTLPDGAPRIVTGSGAVYVRDHDNETIGAIVKALQRTDGVGAIFTAAARAGDMRGRVAGTVSFDAIRWTHERSADILFSDDWTDRKNGYGYAGTTASAGVAGHGSTSPFDIHSVLMAAGPDIRRGATVNLPSGNVDFAPTFLRLLGIAIPSVMEGRVLEEALKDGSERATPRVVPTELSATSADGGYTVRASFSAIESTRGTYRYLDHTRVERR